MEGYMKCLVFIYTFLFIIGFSGNLIMCLVTIYNKNLRSVCNILIGTCCFFDMLLFTSSLAIVYSVMFETSQQLCFYLSIPADLGAFASNACVLMIGIDRLLSITYPIFYAKIEKSKSSYLLLSFLFPIAYSVVLLSFGFFDRDSTSTVICLLPVSLGHAYDIFAITSFFMNLAVPFIYLHVYVKMKKLRLASSTKSILKSLFVTVLLIVFGWMTTDLCGVLSVTLPMSTETSKLIQLFCGVFIFTASSCTVLVYYKLSDDYRLGIRKLFGYRPVQNFTHSNVSTKI